MNSTNVYCQLFDRLNATIVVLTDRHYSLHGATEHERFLVDLLDELAKDVGFEYVLEESSRYGRLDQESGNWTGLIGKLLNKVRMEGHICLCL